MRSYSKVMASASKRIKRKTKFDDSYTEKFNFIVKCSNSVQDHEFKFRCTVCCVNLSCSHGGINDVELHVKSEKHKQFEKTLQRKL